MNQEVREGENKENLNVVKELLYVKIIGNQVLLIDVELCCLFQKR